MILRAEKQTDWYKAPHLLLEKICRYINKKDKSLFWERRRPLEFKKVFKDLSFIPDDVWICESEKILIIIEVEWRGVVINKRGKKQENGVPPNAFKAHCWNLEEVRYRFPEWKIIAIDIAISPHIVKYKQICEESAKRKGHIYYLIDSFEYKIVQKEVYEILQSY